MRLHRFWQDEHNVNGIIEGTIWKQLLIFFFPILFGTFFQQLYNTADAMIVGQFVGKEALAAVGGATSVLVNLVVNLFVGMSTGTMVLVAQRFGAQDPEGVAEGVHNSYTLALVFGLLMTAVGLLAAPAALRLMGTPDDVYGYAVTYIEVYCLGFIPTAIYNTGSAVLRAVGDTKRPLYFLIVSCLTNIVLDLYFVLGLNLGVFGAAAATFISQVVSAVLVTVALLHAAGPIRLNPRRLRFQPKILGQIVKVGLPTGLQSDMYSISNLLIQSTINSFGTDTMAAWTAYGKVDGFFWMVLSAYGIAISTFAGQNFGAQKYDRIRKSVKVCLGMAAGTAVAFSLVFCIFAQPLLGLFTNDRVVLEIGANLARMIMPFYVVYVCTEILSGTIRGAGSALMPMILTGCGICLLRVLWIIFVLPFRRDVYLLLTSYPVTWGITSLLFIVYYLRGGWLRRQIAKNGFAPEEKGKA